MFDPDPTINIKIKKQIKTDKKTKLPLKKGGVRRVVFTSHHLPRRTCQLMELLITHLECYVLGLTGPLSYVVNILEQTTLF